MKLTGEQVRHVAALAQLELSPGEEDRLERQLSAILDAMDELAQVDTTGVPPTTQVAMSHAALRPDEVHGVLPVEVAVGQAPRAAGGAFVIPQVIE